MFDIHVFFRHIFKDSSVSILGSGTYGTAYLLPYKDGKAVLKVSPVCERKVVKEEYSILQGLDGAGGAPRVYGHALGENPKILMEYCGKETLGSALAHGKYGNITGLSLLLQVGRRLEEVHEKGIVHNDLKTNNIVVSDEIDEFTRLPQVSIIDYGMASKVYSLRKFSGTQNKYPWMAPELFKKGGISSHPSSDMYSYCYALLNAMNTLNLRWKLEVQYPKLLRLCRQGLHPVPMYRTKLALLLPVLEETLQKLTVKPS